jgi:hypothetical protein
MEVLGSSSGGEDMIDRTCSSGCFCNYRYQGSCWWGCKYEGYCDYQLPKDSRMQPLMPLCPSVFEMPKPQCTCGTSSTLPCPIHGGGKVQNNG